MVQLGTRMEPRPVPPRAPATRVLITGTFLAGLLAILVGRWWTGTGYVAAPAGLPDPGWVTAVGLPVAQHTHEIAGITVVGLLFLRCAALPASTGPGGAHLLEMAARWAWIWVAGTVAWITLTVSELTGAPVDDLLRSPDLVLAAAGTDRVLAEMATLWVALAVALFVGRLPTAPPVAALLLAATAALLPSALTGHAGHHDSPTIAMLALAVHLAAAAAWVGGLLALVVHLRPFPDELRRASPVQCRGADVPARGRIVGHRRRRGDPADLDRAVGLRPRAPHPRQNRGVGRARRDRIRAPETHPRPGRHRPARPAAQPRRRRTPHHGRDHWSGRDPVNHRITPPQATAPSATNRTNRTGVANNQIRPSPIS